MNYLLTFLSDSVPQYEWFETEEEMQNFIDGNEIEGIFDAIEILASNDVDVDFTPHDTIEVDYDNYRDLKEELNELKKEIKKYEDAFAVAISELKAEEVRTN